MGFDEDVDLARRRLETAIAAEGSENDGFDDLAALEAILPKLKAGIQSRRLAFRFGEDEEETAIEVVHAQTDEPLGFVFAAEGEFVFESNLDAYFDDFVDDDADSFVQRLYETLRADLPKYEIDNAA